MKLNQPINRAGSQSITDTQSVMHEARDHALHSAHKACAACGCDDCADLQGRLEGAPSFEPSANMALDKAQTGDIESRRFAPSYVALDTREHQAIERRNAENLTTILDRLQANGFLNSHQRQMAAAQLAVRPMVNNVAQ